MTERILRMAKASNDHDVFPKTTPVDYDRAFMLEPDVICEASRVAQYLAGQTVQITPDDRFVGMLKFDNSIFGEIFHRTGRYRHYGEFGAKFYKQPFEKLFTRDHQHATGNFGYVIQYGLTGLKEKLAQSRAAHDGEPEKTEYLKALQISLGGIICWEEKCAKACFEAAKSADTPARAKELREMGEILERVPLYPARGFREAVQSLYFCFMFVPDSIGTADRYLLDCYRRDLDSGAITREEAKEYLQELYVMINGLTPPVNKWSSDKGGESHFCIGGYTESGEDGFTELSRLMLEALMEIPTYRPQISLRWTLKTPRSVLRDTMDMERRDAFKRIALVCETRRIESLTQRLGFDFKDAITYTMVGCNEPATQGGMNFGSGDINAVRFLDRLLYDMRGEVLAAKDFEAFYALFERELFADCKRAVEIGDAANRFYSYDKDVLSSLFMDGPIEKGKSITDGGARLGFEGVSYIGTGTVIDSLIVIKQFVYDDRIFTMEKLLDMLAADWEGFEKERLLIYRTARYYGNDDPFATEMARRYTRSLDKFFRNQKDLFGYGYLLGDLIGYCPHNAWFGALTRATPDGRRAGETVSFGAGQSGGRDRNGLAALLNSIADLDPTGVMTGPTVTNLMLDESMIKDDEKFEKTVDLVEAYFRKGGMHVQLNYVSREELEAARKQPEKHENLRVRVSGFSGYYTLLDPLIQSEIIERTRQEG